MHSQAHPAFEMKRSQTIKTLNVTFEEYTHTKTGAQHIHLHADNKENVFMVALRTVPEDSTGVAHILEHTALCGSRKYPVRDPFFMMIRRSLNTFMNAFTSSDWTAYPFATQNKKDFDNLLNVYLDSVFFARLDPLDFAQEGHRLEFAEADNSESPLTFKGIVFNEMKGAMSSINSILWQTLSKYLYPTNTYHYNSGGDPAAIPDLTYEQFSEFYRVHYHPSNAIFLTYGDITAAEHQRKFQDLALTQFDHLDCHIAVADEQRYAEPQYFSETYALDKDETTERKTHIVMAWLLGDSTDLEATMEARLLTSVLLDNSGSPLMQALESSELGTSPSPMCGLEDSQKQLCFACGLEGSEAMQADAVEATVLGIIESVANDGVPLEQVAASLHQLELQQREISSGGYPFGLSLALTALTSATHRGDPMALLDLEPVLDKLQIQIQDPEFIKSLARRLLLNNNHRIRLVMAPDTELAAQRERTEKQRLADVQQSLSAAEKDAIIVQAKALKVRQEAKENMDILPKVGIADIPAEITYAEKLERAPKRVPITRFGAGTNGLVYQRVILPFPEFSETQLDLLPLYSRCVTQLGVGHRDYQEAQRWQASVVGSFSASASVRADKADLNVLRGNITYAVKGLARNHGAITTLLEESIDTVRFDEPLRLRELIAQIRSQQESSVVGNGHALAMASAASALSPSAHLSQRWGGLNALSRIKALDQRIADSDHLAELASQLKGIHQLIKQQPRHFLLVSETDKVDGFSDALERVFSPDGHSFTCDPYDNLFDYQPELSPESVCWTTNTQVSFCAKAFPTVESTHPDAAALTVLGGVLRNGFLHRKIREQGGAYGGGASQDSQSGAFRFFSYRDPRIEGTLNDFDESVAWLVESPLETAQIEESILGVISSLDKPTSPAGEAISAFYDELNGRGKASKLDFRQRILSVSKADLKRVASSYLAPNKGVTSVITNADLGIKSGLKTVSV